MSARFRKTRRYTNVVCCEVLSARIGKTGRYTNGLLLPEDPAFGAQPRPECSANFFLGRTHSFNLSFSFPRFVAWPLELGLGTHNPRFFAWPLELGVEYGPSEAGGVGAYNHLCIGEEVEWRPLLL